MSKKHESFESLKSHNLYQNCYVLGPDGILLCRASEKKLNWYLKRGLATLVSSEPFTIQLTFQPAGEGSRNDPYNIADKVNCCVVCGSTENLTKHHVIPYTFRRHFPDPLKDHQSHDVLLTCRDCHSAYEPEAQKLHRLMCHEYGVTESPEQTYEQTPQYKLVGLCRTILRYGDKLPPERRAEIEQEIKEFGGDDVDYVAAAQLSFAKKKRRHSSYGKSVAQAVDYREFSRRWRRHFVEVMNPQHLPDHWNPERAYEDDNWRKAMEPKICPECYNGTLVDTVVERDQDYDGTMIHVALPADKCLVCGQVWFTKKSAQAEIIQICAALGIKCSGHSLNVRREQNGFTLDSLSELSGIDRDILSKYENNRSVPTREHDELLLSLLRRPKGN